MEKGTDSSWKAFRAWVLCGALWGVAWFGIFSIGPVALPFAAAVTILLAHENLSSRIRRVIWIMYAGWLVAFGVAFLMVVPWGFFLYVTALAFLAVMVRAGASGWGILVGFGFWPLQLAVTSVDPVAAWGASAAVLIGVPFYLFTKHRVSTAHVPDPASDR